MQPIIVRDQILFDRAVGSIQSLYLSLSAETISELRNYWSPVFIQKGKPLLKKESNEKKCWFILEGGVRIFFKRKKKSITLQFVFEGGVVNNFDSPVIDGSSALQLEATENSILMEMNSNMVEMLTLKFPEIALLWKRVEAENLRSYQSHLMSILFEKAEQRYDSLLTNTPWILKRVAIGHIASYLGISAESLSRIRHKKNALAALRTSDNQ